MPTNEEIVQGIINSGLSEPEQLSMAIAICDVNKVMNQLKLNAQMVHMGMGTVSPVDELVYVILKIARPDLFEGAGNGD